MNMLTAPFLETTKKTCSTEKAIPQDVSCVNGPGSVIICPLVEKRFSFHTASPTNVSIVCTPPDPTVTTRALISICAASLQSVII